MKPEPFDVVTAQGYRVARCSKCRRRREMVLTEVTENKSNPVMPYVMDRYCRECVRGRKVLDMSTGRMIDV